MSDFKWTILIYISLTANKPQYTAKISLYIFQSRFLKYNVRNACTVVSGSDPSIINDQVASPVAFSIWVESCRGV